MLNVLSIKKELQSMRIKLLEEGNEIKNVFKKRIYRRKIEKKKVFNADTNI